MAPSSSASAQPMIPSLSGRVPQDSRADRRIGLDDWSLGGSAPNAGPNASQNNAGPSGGSAEPRGPGVPPRVGVAMTATEQQWGEEVKVRKKEAECAKLPDLPTARSFHRWKMNVRNELAGASGDPQKAFTWILKVEEVGKTSDSPEDSENFSARSSGPRLLALPRATSAKRSLSKWRNRLKLVQ